MRDVVEPELGQLLAAVAGALAEAVVDAQPASVEADLGNAGGCALEHDAQARLAIPEGTLDLGAGLQLLLRRLVEPGVPGRCGHLSDDALDELELFLAVRDAVAHHLDDA